MRDKYFYFMSLLQFSDPNSIVPIITSVVPIHQVLFSTSPNNKLPNRAYKEIEIRCKKLLIRNSQSNASTTHNEDTYIILTVVRKLDAVFITET